MFSVKFGAEVGHLVEVVHLTSRQPKLRQIIDYFQAFKRAKRAQNELNLGRRHPNILVSHSLLLVYNES